MALYGGDAGTDPDVAAEAAEAARRRLEALFDDHHRWLWRLALRMTSDPEVAQDLVQETFLRAARHIDRIPRDAGGPWLGRALVNLCRDRYRRLDVRERAEPQQRALVPPEPDQEAALVARLTVEKAVASLRPRRRAVLVLCELEGREVADVAALLGLRQVTVRWHLMAARRQLRRWLEDT
jgi:RNA polymerase sigma-70 factor (ECF subfamily)